MKLTDTQLIVLSSAAKHNDGLATRPANLNAAAAMKVFSSLVAKGLAREIRAKADAPVWHENDDGRFALKITRAGRKAIGVDDDETQDAAPVSVAPAQPRSKKSGSKPAGKKDARNTSGGNSKGAQKNASGDGESSPADFRAGSKQAKIVMPEDTGSFQEMSRSRAPNPVEQWPEFVPKTCLDDIKNEQHP